MIILFKLLGVFAFLYFVQLIVVAVMFYSGAYDTKKTLFRDLIPFYWVKVIFIAIVETTVDQWNSLDNPNQDDDGY